MSSGTTYLANQKTEKIWSKLYEGQTRCYNAFHEYADKNTKWYHRQFNYDFADILKRLDPLSDYPNKEFKNALKQYVSQMNLYQDLLEKTSAIIFDINLGLASPSDIDAFEKIIENMDKTST